MKEKIKQLVEEINSKSKKELVFVLISGIIGILWPLGGLMIFALCLKSKYVLCGKIALLSSAIVMVCFIFKAIVISVF